MQRRGAPLLQPPFPMPPGPRARPVLQPVSKKVVPPVSKAEQIRRENQRIEEQEREELQRFEKKLLVVEAERREHQAKQREDAMRVNKEKRCLDEQSSVEDRRRAREKQIDRIQNKQGRAEKWQKELEAAADVHFPPAGGVELISAKDRVLAAKKERQALAEKEQRNALQGARDAYQHQKLGAQQMLDRERGYGAPAKNGYVVRPRGDGFRQYGWNKGEEAESVLEEEGVDALARNADVDLAPAEEVGEEDVQLDEEINALEEAIATSTLTIQCLEVTLGGRE